MLDCFSICGQVSSTFWKPSICLGGPRHIIIKDVIRATTMGTVRTMEGSRLHSAHMRGESVGMIVVENSYVAGTCLEPPGLLALDG